MKELTIKVKYLPGAHELEQVKWGSWIDLYVYEDTVLKQGERKYINLGLSMELPKGYEAIMAPRSSTFKNWHLIQTNSIGVIDSSYNGDNDIWMLPVYCFEDVIIPKDTRLCQFRILKEQSSIKFESVESLQNKNRGGLGHSGL